MEHFFTYLQKPSDNLGPLSGHTCGHIVAKLLIQCFNYGVSFEQHFGTLGAQFGGRSEDGLGGRLGKDLGTDLEGVRGAVWGAVWQAV